MLEEFKRALRHLPSLVTHLTPISEVRQFRDSNSSGDENAIITDYAQHESIRGKWSQSRTRGSNYSDFKSINFGILEKWSLIRGGSHLEVRLYTGFDTTGLH